MVLFSLGFQICSSEKLCPSSENVNLRIKTLLTGTASWLLKLSCTSSEIVDELLLESNYELFLIFGKFCDFLDVLFFLHQVKFSTYLMSNIKMSTHEQSNGASWIPNSAIDPFENNAGKITKMLIHTVER